VRGVRIRGPLVGGLLCSVSLVVAQACGKEPTSAERPALARPLGSVAPIFDPTINIAAMLDSFAVGGVYTVLGGSGYPRLVSGALLYAAQPEASVYSSSIRGHPTGIDLPVGLPVRILAEGTIVSTSTDAFRSGYCLRPGSEGDPNCTFGDLRYSVHGLEPDTGVLFPYSAGTALQVEWTRLGARTFATYPSPQFFRGPVPTTVPGSLSELHFHRTAGCCFYPPFGDAAYSAWETYSGRWRFGAVVDDGGRQEFGEPALLTMTGPHTDAAMTSPADFTLTAADGGSLSAVQWWFIRPAMNTFDGISPGTAPEFGTAFIAQAYPSANRSTITPLSACAGMTTCSYQSPAAGAVVAQASLSNGTILAARNVQTAPPPQEVTLAVELAAGPNLNGSFTTYAGEDTIRLRAVVSPAGLAPMVKWTVVDFPGDQVVTAAPSVVSDGASSAFVVPHTQDVERLATPHLAPLNRLKLAYWVSARVTDNAGNVVTTEPKLVSQDEIDSAREEYSELRARFPAPERGAYVPFPANISTNLPGRNGGDYGVAVFEPGFMTQLEAVKSRWIAMNRLWQENVLYRGAAHNRFHTGGSTSSGAARTSTHMWGCGVDVQTFPAPRSTPVRLTQAQRFWRDLAEVIRETNPAIVIEPPVATRPGQLASTWSHVHFQLCPGDIR
jgi:hypothetical protein